MVLTRSSLVVAFTVLVLGALSGIADAQVSVEVLPLPRHPFPQLGQSRQSLPIGISRDGRFVSGNGFQSFSSGGGGYEFPIAWQYDRTTGQLSYPGEEPSAETGLPFRPNQSEFGHVSRSGQAGFLAGTTGPAWVWQRGVGHTRVVAGTSTEYGDLYAVSSDGRSAIGEVINNVTHDWSVVWHDGVWQRPAGPDPYEYSVLLSDDGSTFTNELNQIYRFGEGWTILPQDVGLFSISSDGRRVAGRMAAGNAVVWSAAMGFESLPPEIVIPLYSNSDLSAFVYGNFLWSRWGGLLDVGAQVVAGGQLPTGFAFAGLSGVSDDGTVLSGVAWNAAEQRSVSIFVTIPTPGTLPIVAALSLLIRSRRRVSLPSALAGALQ